MSQENQGTMENAPVKRKRGRPRKDETLVRGELDSTSPPVTDTVRRNRRRRVDQISDAMVGQVVSGVLEGSFDAGYLLTVKVGNTNTVLRGVVFEPGLSVPISVANDVAPHVKMFKRNEISLPTQVRGTNLQSEQNNERLVKVSGNEGVLASKVSPPVKQAPKAPQLSPSQVQTNPMAFSKGEVNNANNVLKTAPHALQPEESKAKSSPSLAAKGVTGEASGDANHSVQVSLQPAPSQTENRMLTDVTQNDKSGLPTRDAPHALPPDGSEAQRSPSLPAKGLEVEASGDTNHAVQVSLQQAPSQTENRMPTDAMQNEKSCLPTREVEGLPVDAGQVVQVSTQTAAPQIEQRKSIDSMSNDKSDHPTREAEGLPVDAGQVVEVSLQTAAPQIEQRKSIDSMSDDKSDHRTSEPEGMPSDINQMVHVPSQVGAMKSTCVSLDDKSDLPAREPEGSLNDASQVVEDSLQSASSQIGNRKSANMLPDDKTDLLTRELDSSNQASLIKPEQVVQPVIKGEPSATQSSQLEHDGAAAPAEILRENEAAALIKQPLEDLNAAEDLEFIPSAEPSVEKLSGGGSIDQVTQVQSQVMISELQPGWHADDALTSGSSEVKLNCIPVSDPPEPVTTQPDSEVTNLVERKASPKGDTPQDLTSKFSGEIPSRANFSHSDGRPKADVSEATEGHTESESQISQPVDMFYRGSSPAASRDMETVHVASLPVLLVEVPQPLLNNSAMSLQNEDGISKDASLQFQMLQRKSPPAAYDAGAENMTAQPIQTDKVAEAQTSYTYLSMQNEDGISKDASFSEQQSQALQKGTTPILSLDMGAKEETTQSMLPKEGPGPQISTSTLPIQNEDGVLQYASAGAQTQCDPVEPKVTDSMSS